MKITGITFLALLCLWMGCAPTELSPQAYLRWLNEPDGVVMREKEQGDFTFRLQYLPSEAMALNEYGIEAVGNADWTDILAAYDSAWYFQFRMVSKADDVSVVSYKTEKGQEVERIAHFSFGLQKELKLLHGTDTLDCSLFHFERNYQLAPYASFLLAFEKDPIGSKDRNQPYELTFLYSDTQLGVGQVLIPLGRDMFIHLPKLQY